MNVSIPQSDNAKVRAIKERYSLDLLSATVLERRGARSGEDLLYYLENDNSLSGIQQLLAQIKEKAFEAIPAAGPSWRSETKKEYPPHSIVEGRVYVNPGQSTVGVDKDGSDVILSSFCQACITGEKARDVVEEAYCATLLCLLANQAMEEGRTVIFPEEYRIPYMKF